MAYEVSLNQLQTMGLQDREFHTAFPRKLGVIELTN